MLGARTRQGPTRESRRKGVRRRLSREEYRELREAVRKMYRDSNFSQSFLARVLKLPYSTVQYWCQDEVAAKERRMESGGVRVRPKDQEEVLRLYEDELLSVDKISRQRGLRRSIVNRIICDHLSKAQRHQVVVAREAKRRDFRISVVRRWAEGKASFPSLEKELKLSRSTLSGWVRRTDLPADLRAKVAERLPTSRRGSKPRAPSKNARSPDNPRSLETQPTYRTGTLCAYQVQAMLADIGLAAGYDVWIPGNDSRRVQERMLRTGLCQIWPASHLPKHLDSIIRNIDVTWLREGIVTHCYEVEHSTSVTTGIARIRDAQEMFPNFLVRGYIVGKSAKRRKFANEMMRPSLSASADRTASRPIAFIDQNDLRGAFMTQAASGHLSSALVQEHLDKMSSVSSQSHF